MAIKRLSEISPGMVLAGDVRDMSGRLLLSTGGEISKKHLRIFKMWGVSEADIEEPAAAGSETEGRKSPFAATVDAQPQPGCQGIVQDLFRHNDANHPLIAELMKQCLQVVGAGSGRDGGAGS